VSHAARILLDGGSMHASITIPGMVAAGALVACGPNVARLTVAPSAVVSAPEVVGDRGCIAVFVAPALTKLEAHAGYGLGFRDSGPGLQTIEVTWTLGPAVAAVVERGTREAIPGVRRTSDGRCDDGERATLEFALYRPPIAQLRWVPRLASEEGGATLEVVVACTLRDCDGRRLWSRNVAGYGSAARAGKNKFLYAVPYDDQFQPAADAMLVDLARNLSRALETLPVRCAASAPGGA
jgi:hypothetical protein